MKRRVISLLLMVVMLFSMAAPALALNTDYSFHIEATDATLGSNQGLSLKLYAKGPKFASTQSILLGFDATKLMPVTSSGGYSDMSNAFKANVNSMGIISDQENWEDMATKPGGFISNVTVIGGTNNDSSTYYIGVQPEFTGNYTAAATAEKLLATFSLAFVGDTTSADLDKTSLWVLSASEVNTVGQSEAAVATNGDDITINYNPADSTADKSLAEPTLTLNGNPLPAGVIKLTGIDVALDQTEVTVNGTTGGTVNATATLKPDGATGTVAWSVSPTNRGVSINSDTGVVTIGNKATAGTYTVTATSGSVTGTKTFEVKKAAAAAQSMTVTATDKTAVYGTAKNITPTFTVKDQYGDNVPSPTITMDTAAGFTFNGTTVAVANNATVGDHTLTFKCGTASATLVITVGKANGPAAPSITVEDAATKGGNGKLKGTDTTMEYNTSATATTGWKACSATETAVPAGTYYVRVAETATHKAGAVTAALVINQPGTSTQPVVSITGGGQIEEGASATLTATISNQAACTGTLTYKWYKDNVEISGETTNTITVNEAGTYKVEVTHTNGANDPATGSATASVTVKGKTDVKVAKKTTASQTEGTLNAQNLVTVTDGTWDQVKDAVTTTIYKFVAAAAEDDDTTADIDESKDHYEVVTGGLTEGTYYVDVAVAAIVDKADYKVDAVPGVGAPDDATAPDALAGYVKLTVTKQTDGGYVPSSYTVRYNAGTNGTLNGNASENVKRGQKPANVPTVTANEGYMFRGWSQNGTTIVDPTTVTINSNVTFTALYAPVKNTYISGYPDGTFRPDASVTRAEIASMLARLSKDFDAKASYTGTATDVAANAWYASFVNFGMQKGIIRGHEDGTFRPDANITRGEFAAMLARYMGLTNGGSKQFSDTADHWASASIAALADAGIVTGYNDGSFQPNASLTRAEAVQMINTALKVSTTGVTYDVVPTDVSSAHWAYTQILTAMNTDIKDIVK